MGPKGPLWEEISVGMTRLGYKRNSKRCKEKWEIYIGVYGRCGLHYNGSRGISRLLEHSGLMFIDHELSEKDKKKELKAKTPPYRTANLVWAIQCIILIFSCRPNIIFGPTATLQTVVISSIDLFVLLQAQRATDPETPSLNPNLCELSDYSDILIEIVSFLFH
ncbi:uncharacterized protein LOC120003632 [Tripterygium wilfordii]|uniref:uncharacterized protein LOC120003632 n=1 Tax=Tripterygium wilfordii TaxID=458696 RepID=UPI0018F83BCA|nr:uncharacterized protein LOC120003632 [Tripterygium wilfordii]